jgi:fatty acid synthase subunit alpha
MDGRQIRVATRYQHKAKKSHLLLAIDVIPHANFRFEFPALETVKSLNKLSKLRGLIDSEKVVIITDYAEVGPWGSSPSRAASKWHG